MIWIFHHFSIHNLSSSPFVYYFFFLHWSALFSLVDFSGCASLFLLSTSLSSLFLPCLSCAISQQISFSLQHPFYPLRMLLYSPLVCFFLIYLIITIKLASLLPRILNVLCTNFQWLDDLEIPHKKMFHKYLHRLFYL